MLAKEQTNLEIMSEDEYIIYSQAQVLSEEGDSFLSFSFTRFENWPRSLDFDKNFREAGLFL